MSLPTLSCSRICSSLNSNQLSSYFSVTLFNTKIHQMKVNSVFCAEEQVVDSNQAQDNETKSVKIFYKNLEAEIRRKVSAHKAKNEKPKFLVFTIIDYQILLTDPTKIPLDISSTWDCQKLSTEIKVDIKTKPIYAFGLAGGLDNKTSYNVTPLTVILPIKQKAYEVGECSNLEKFEFRGEQGRLSWKNLALQSGSSGEGEVNLRCLLRAVGSFFFFEAKFFFF